MLAAPLEASGALPSCQGGEATKLSFDRAPGAPTGRLSWSAPNGFAPHGYEVYEGGRVVGETSDRSIAVKVKAGNTYVFSVRTLDATAQKAGCVSRLRQSSQERSLNQPGSAWSIRSARRSAPTVVSR